MLRALPFLLILVSCGPDETLTGYANPDATYVLTRLDQNEFPARATLKLSQTGTISGNGPCNSFSAEQSAPYPWFAAGPIRATRRACPDLGAETTYFDALSAMTISEALGDVLILSNDAGREMVFQVE